jgi:hypothetical protein
MDENRDLTVVYRSTDGGKSWAQVLATTSIPRSGDPVCGFAPDGTAFFVTLATELPKKEKSKMLVYRSTDGGASWSAPQRLPIIDRQYLVVDNTKGKYNGRLYIHGTGGISSIDGAERKNEIDLFTSTDNGLTWNGSVRRASLGRGWILGTAGGVVLSDGTLALLFGEVIDYSKEGGRQNVDEPSPNQPNSRLKLLTSSDGGDSFEPAKPVSDWHFAWPPTSKCCVPWLAVDPGSQPFKDRLYAVWTDIRSGHGEIFFAYSADKGKTWSKPKVVGNDDIGRVGAEGRDDFQPVVEVNTDGVVGVMWHDRRDSPDNLGWRIRFTASLDGGETFLPSVEVSNAPNSYGPKTPWVTAASVSGGGTERSKGGTISLSAGVSGFTYNGGHTVAMPIDSRGVFHPMWVDNRAGLPQVWTADVFVKAPVTKHGETELSALDDISENVTLDLSGTSFDRDKGLLTIKGRLKNTSKETLRAPFKARVVMLRSDLGVPEIRNADNGRQGAGAVWDFTPFVKSGILKPDEQSEPKTLIFHLSNLKPFLQGKEFKFGLVNLNTVVLGKMEKTEKAEKTEPAETKPEE